MFKTKQPQAEPALSTYSVTIQEFGTTVNFQAASPDEAGMIVDAINSLLANATHGQIVKLAGKLNSNPTGIIQTAAKFC